MRIPILALALSTTAACATAPKDPPRDPYSAEVRARERAADANRERLANGAPDAPARGRNEAPPPRQEAPREAAQKQTPQARVVEHCAATRAERVADVKAEIAQWVKDSMVLEKAGGLEWYARHCQRGLDQFGELMPAVCNAKLPPGGTRQTVDIALDRLVDLNDHGPSGINEYVPTERADLGKCFNSDADAGFILLIKRNDTKAMQRLLDAPPSTPSGTEGTAATSATPSTPASGKKP